MAGAWGAVITEAVQLFLLREPRAVQVGLELDSIDTEVLRASAPDLLISAAHSRLIRQSDIVIPAVGTIGIHPSVLPKYRGSHPLWWALKNGEREVGVTIYVLDDGIDTGPIIAQKRVPVAPDDTFMSVYLRVARLIPAMLEDLLTVVIETGHLPEATPQDHRLATHFRAPTLRDTTTYRLLTRIRRLRRFLRRAT